jgi:hypothetical protein
MCASLNTNSNLSLKCLFPWQAGTSKERQLDDDGGLEENTAPTNARRLRR